MKLAGIIWYHDIVEKLEWKHNVYKNEVKEIFSYAKQFRFIEKDIARMKICIPFTGKQRTEDIS